MATTPDRRVTESGIEVKPVYGPGDASGAAEPPGRVPVHARARTPTCTAAARGRCASTPGFGSAEETNARFHTLLSRGQTGLSVAFDLPTQLGYDSDDPVAEGEVGRTGVAIDSVDDMARLLRRDPARRGLDLDDDQRAGCAAPALLRARRGGAGRRPPMRFAERCRTTS